jgi:hypothetical protein
MGQIPSTSPSFDETLHVSLPFCYEERHRSHSITLRQHKGFISHLNAPRFDLHRPSFDGSNTLDIAIIGWVKYPRHCHDLMGQIPSTLLSLGGSNTLDIAIIGWVKYPRHRHHLMGQIPSTWPYCMSTARCTRRAAIHGRRRGCIMVDMELADRHGVNLVNSPRSGFVPKKGNETLRCKVPVDGNDAVMSANIAAADPQSARVKTMRFMLNWAKGQ